LFCHGVKVQQITDISMIFSVKWLNFYGEGKIRNTCEVLQSDSLILTQKVSN
jgi:hypothetical protein